MFRSKGWAFGRGLEFNNRTKGNFTIVLPREGESTVERYPCPCEAVGSSLRD